MKKALLTATVQHHFVYFHFPLIDLLHENGYEVHIAARDVLGGETSAMLKEKADVVFDVPFERSPFNSGNKAAYAQLKKIIDENDYDVIDCNTPMGGILTRLAARKARKKGTKVIYTAHGFHFYKGASKAGWLIYYPVERFFGRHFTDCLITICDEDEKTAHDRKICKNIRRIHGVGVDAKKFSPVDSDEKLQIRHELEFDESAIICLCTGELNENKNQKLFISAVPEVLEKYPDFRLLLAGAGDKEPELKELAKTLKVENSVGFLGYRNDIASLVPASDFVCSASFREGLPVNIIEAMCCAKPAVVSRNRGHNELVAEGESGFFVPSADSHAAAEAMLKLCDSERCLAMGKAAYEHSQNYTTDRVKNELKSILTDVVFSVEKG